MKLSEELQNRGFVYQHSSDTLEEIFDNGITRTVYLGIDPTADSMHVGHLVPYMMLNHIMNAGHKVIALMGGGTALIGDPSFKTQERDIASVEEIQTQCQGLEENVRKITTSENIRFVNNYDWLSKLTAIEFLRDVGKHFTVNNMIKKESVARRFEGEEGISYTEFSYSLLQGYDFYHLNQEYNCDVQIGGSDQWGNIIAGVDYVRRRTGKEVYALTMPLIVDKATGKKFGKSEGNAPWLDAEKTSPYQFYQFWFNVSDESVIDYLKLFTFLSLEEIEAVEKRFRDNPGGREAQKVLAENVTNFIHGEVTTNAVVTASNLLFGEGSLSDLTPGAQTVLIDNAPNCLVKGSELLVEVLVKADLATSKREARTFMESGAVALNGSKVNDIDAKLKAADFTNKLALLKRGKKQLSVLVLE